MYSMHNEEKSVVVERFIGTLKNKIYKYITLISKNVNVDKLGDIVRKYNNAYHRTTKMKLIDVKPKPKINLIKKIIIKILNLILAIMWEYQNTKTFLQKITFQIGPKKFLLLKKLKMLCRGYI